MQSAVFPITELSLSPWAWPGPWSLPGASALWKWSPGSLPGLPSSGSPLSLQSWSWWDCLNYGRSSPRDQARNSGKIWLPDLVIRDADLGVLEVPAGVLPIIHPNPPWLLPKALGPMRCGLYLGIFLYVGQLDFLSLMRGPLEKVWSSFLHLTSLPLRYERGQLIYSPCYPWYHCGLYLWTGEYAGQRPHPPGSLFCHILHQACFMFSCSSSSTALVFCLRVPLSSFFTELLFVKTTKNIFSNQNETQNAPCVFLVSWKKNPLILSSLNQWGLWAIFH